MGNIAAPSKFLAGPIIAKEIFGDKIPMAGSIQKFEFLSEIWRRHYVSPIVFLAGATCGTIGKWPAAAAVKAVSCF